MRRTASALDLAAAHDALDVARGLAGYLLGCYEPDTPHDRADMAGYDVAALRDLAGRYPGHRLAAQVLAKVETAVALGA